MTKEEKRLIGRHSAPPWELDIVGYSARENLLPVVECKSYMDSTGVRASAFDGSNPEHAIRYKLFNEPELRRVVFNRLCLQFTEAGACRERAQVRRRSCCLRKTASGIVPMPLRDTNRLYDNLAPVLGAGIHDPSSPLGALTLVCCFLTYFLSAMYNTSKCSQIKLAFTMAEAGHAKTR